MLLLQQQAQFFLIIIDTYYSVVDFPVQVRILEAMLYTFFFKFFLATKRTKNCRGNKVIFARILNYKYLIHRLLPRNPALIAQLLGSCITQDDTFVGVWGKYPQTN